MNSGVQSSNDGLLSTIDGVPIINRGLQSINGDAPNTNDGPPSINRGLLSTNESALSFNHGLPGINRGVSGMNRDVRDITVGILGLNDVLRALTTILWVSTPTFRPSTEDIRNHDACSRLRLFSQRSNVLRRSNHANPQKCQLIESGKD